jgi:hypothetical protein
MATGNPGLSTGIVLPPHAELFRSHGAFDDAACNADP